MESCGGVGKIIVEENARFWDKLQVGCERSEWPSWEQLNLRWMTPVGVTYVTGSNVTYVPVRTSLDYTLEEQGDWFDEWEVA